MKILVTGTPGVGKTTFSKILASEFHLKHIDITNFIKENKLYESYDKKFDTYVFDEDFVAENLIKTVEKEKSFIVDTHSPCIACDIQFDYIFHLRCDIKELTDRLKARNYNETKVTENVEAEIFNVISEELEEFFEEDSNIFIINGSDKPIEDANLSTSDAIELLKNHNIQAHKQIK